MECVRCALRAESFHSTSVPLLLFGSKMFNFLFARTHKQWEETKAWDYTAYVAFLTYGEAAYNAMVCNSKKLEVLRVGYGTVRSKTNPTPVDPTQLSSHYSH